MAKKFAVPFAQSGDKAAIPTGVQPDGSVSFAQGFGPDYELDKSVDPVNAKDVPRDQTNQLYFDITDAIGEIQAKGFAPWSNDINYSAKAFALGPTNGFLYIALQPSGPSSAPKNPESESAYWERFASRGMQVFNSAGVTSWTVPMAMQLGIIKPTVQLWGGGGGGSYTGAGAGGYSEKIVDLTGVATVTITIGPGGIFNNVSSNNGGTTSFGAIFSATGGTGGGTSGDTDVSRPVGGAGVGGDINISGGSGAAATRFADGGAAAVIGVRALGSTSAANPPQNGRWPGGGGAGRANQVAPAAGNGDGAAGGCAIKW